MDPSIALATFPLIFIGELPDKTMFASLTLASRGRARAVWLGASVGFALQVVIATTIGTVLYHLVPHRVLEAVVAAAFLAGAVWSFRSRGDDEPVEARPTESALRTAAVAAGVIFLAEWGDLTQILTIELVARYHSPLSVGIGALAALVAVAGLAVGAGSTLLRVVPVRTLRIVTAVVLLALAVWAAVGAIS